MASGIVDELVNHPGGVLADAAIGVGLGVATAVAAPEVAVAAAAVGAGYGAYQLYENVGGWINSADTVANPSQHSPEQIRQAEIALQGFGKGTTEFLAGSAGATSSAMAVVGVKNFLLGTANSFINAMTRPHWDLSHLPPDILAKVTRPLFQLDLESNVLPIATGLSATQAITTPE